MDVKALRHQTRIRVSWLETWIQRGGEECATRSKTHTEEKARQGKGK